MRYGIYSRDDGRFLRGGLCSEAIVQEQPHDDQAEVVVGIPRFTVPGRPENYFLRLDTEEEGFNRLGVIDAAD